MSLTYKLELLHSYIKDLSLEVLDPLLLIKNKHDGEGLQVEISPLAVKHRVLKDDNYEVATECKILITQKDVKVLALQIEYNGLFNVTTERPEDILEILYVNCANVLYPFLRSEVANLTLATGSSAIILPFLNFADQFKELKKEVN